MRLISDPEELLRLFRRREISTREIEEKVEGILQEIRSGGDRALERLSREIEGIELDSIEVKPEEVEEGLREAGDFLPVLREAARRISDFHKRQREIFGLEGAKEVSEGIKLRIVPLRSVGIYAPRGARGYPSSVLMTAIPAREAGVEEIYLASPPGPDGRIPPSVLASAHIAGVKRIFKLGGALAAGAFAFGTETVPKVDKICGPGGLFFTAAKRKVFGEVGIDGLCGPTEALILADEEADPESCAADLLAQGEHAGALIGLITDSRSLAEEVQRELEARAPLLPGSREAVERGFILIVGDLREGARIADLLAPEHLSLYVRNPEELLDLIGSAGAIFLGEGSPEVLGDYIAGPSHVMPTGGAARFSSALGVWDFVKFIPVFEFEKAPRELLEAAEKLALLEDFRAHAEAARLRLRKEGR